MICSLARQPHGHRRRKLQGDTVGENRLRRQSKGNFTIIANDCFRDNQLSAEALGVICYLRSKPADWVVMPTELSNRFGCGRDRILRILKELIALGYLQKMRERDPETKAWKPVEYIIPDTVSEPLTENTEVAHEPPPENLPLGNPSMANPAMANPTLLNTESTNNGFELKTDLDSARDKRLPSDWPADFQTQWWKIYPRREDKKSAMKSLDKIAMSGKTPWDELVTGTQHYAEFCRGKEMKYTKLPATFLNKESWKNTYDRNHERSKSFFDAASDLIDGTGTDYRR